MKKSVLIAIDIIIAAFIIAAAYKVTRPQENRHKPFNGDVSQSGIIDNNGVMDDEDMNKELESYIQQTASQLEMNICIYIAGEDEKNRSDHDIEIFAMDYYDKKYGEDTDGVLYYLDASGKSPAYDYFTMSGKAYFVYDGKTETILDAIFAHLPPSTEPLKNYHVEGAVHGMCDQLKASYDLGGISSFKVIQNQDEQTFIYKQGSQIVVTTHKPPIVYLAALLIYAVVGLIVAAIVYAVVKSRYKFKNGQNASVYVSKSRTRFNENSDVFLRSHTSKHKIESSSSGGSSHRSGGGGGGGGRSYHGSHGGGGRHR